MAGENFKTLEIINGEEYIFNYKIFNYELKRLSRIAKKNGDVTSIEEYRSRLADTLAVSPEALKQWESGRNGVSDLQRVKEISRCFLIKDYRTLLTPKSNNHEKTEENKLMNRTIDKQERKAARKMFRAFVDMLFVFKNTDGYQHYGDNGAPDLMDAALTLDDLEISLRKAAFDLPGETYENLLLLFNDLTYDEVGSFPDIFDTEEYATFCETDFSLSYFPPQVLFAERKFDEYFNRLCEIMKDYRR